MSALPLPLPCLRSRKWLPVLAMHHQGRGAPPFSSLSTLSLTSCQRSQRASAKGSRYGGEYGAIAAAAMTKSSRFSAMATGSQAEKEESRRSKSKGSHEGKQLGEIEWESTFIDSLPGDKDFGGGPRQVHGAFYSRVEPTGSENKAYVIAHSRESAGLLGLNEEECTTSEFANVFGGKTLMEGMKPFAQNYGGHQFGHWAGQLGDGRAMSLGEVARSFGAGSSSGQRWEVQLKGAGVTPYSRRADGRAVLRSSIREFLCSEAMFHLGIPTTRALSIVGTGDGVWRDMFYNGNVQLEKGAVVCRLAPSFIRFGTFQLPAIRGGGGEGDEEDCNALVKDLADYVIEHHFKDLDLEFEEGSGKKSTTGKYEKFFAQVVEDAARLVVDWQSVGFVHGVLNTDNMSILGLTIDYGPFGFLEKFDVNYTPNTTDIPGYRYCYKNQPQIFLWNLAQLGSALATSGLVDVDKGQDVLDRYGPMLTELYEKKVACKFGLSEYSQDLAIGLMQLMQECKADFTNTYRSLSEITARQNEKLSELTPGLRAVLQEAEASEEKEKDWLEWMHKYQSLLKEDAMGLEEQVKLQDATNPCYILRNHLCQEAIEAADEENYQPLKDLLDVLRNPYVDQGEGKGKYRKVIPKELEGPGVSQLSCSS